MSAAAAQSTLGLCYSLRDPVPQAENAYLEGKLYPVSFGVHEWTYYNHPDCSREKQT